MNSPLCLLPCQPPLWAKSGHAQTIFGHLLPSPFLQTSGSRVEILLPDGDRLVGKYYDGKSRFIFYLFHGLSGSYQADYMQRTALVALRQSHSVFLVNHRGVNPGRTLAKKIYHSGSWPDLAEAISFGRKSFPDKKHIAIGFSLSGNALLSLISQTAASLPDAAICVNSPIDLKNSALKLQKGMNRLYDLRFVLKGRKDILDRHKEGLMKKYQVPMFSTLYDFDAQVTAPEGGFKSREHYYESCSSLGGLSQIRVPHIILTAEDDPFVDIATYRQAKFSDSCFFHSEKSGGHMGYIAAEKTPLGTTRWQDYAISESIKCLTKMI